MQTIFLSEYDAVVDGENGHQISLGTWDSYGIEKLKVVPKTGWENMTITATFVTPNKSIRVLVPEDGVVSVPQEATAKPFLFGFNGKIVFSGVSDGVQRITTDLPFTVLNHAPVEGDTPSPTPSVWEQFVSQVSADANRAESAAQQAEDAAGRAEQASENAAASEKNAAQSAAAALQSANAAAQSAKDSAAELGKVQNASAEALSGIGAANQSALTDISLAKDGAVSDVTGAGTTQTGKVENAGTEALKGIDTAKTSAVSAVEAAGTKAEQDIGSTKETALGAISDAQGQATQAVQQAGTDEVSKVNDAGAAQTKAVQDEGAKQAQLVTETGDAQAKRLESLVPTVYTKAESDARYAPIEAAIKVIGKGTGLVSLSPTVPWQLQGLKIYGRSWQDGTPSVENPVPIQSAGQSGTVDVTVCGENLIPIAKASQTINGITFDVQNDGSIKVSGAFEDDVFSDFYIYGQNMDLGEYIHIPKGAQITCEYMGNTSQSGSVFVILRDKTRGALIGQKNINNALSESDVYAYAIFIRASSQKPFVSGGVAKLWSNFPGRTDYQPYQQPQQLPIPTPDGLPGIPVKSGGNYTDENGQAWVGDVVDFGAKTKVKNAYTLKVSQYLYNLTKSSNAVGDTYFITVSGKDTLSVPNDGFTGRISEMLCNYFKPGNAYGANITFDIANIGTAEIQQNMRFCFGPTGSMPTLEDAKAWFESHDVVVMYPLATPIVTLLTDEELAAYRALQSYPGTTNVIAPDAGIEASALADPNQYIEERIQKAVTQAVTQAVAITGGTAQ